MKKIIACFLSILSFCLVFVGCNKKSAPLVVDEPSEEQTLQVDNAKTTLILDGSTAVAYACPDRSMVSTLYFSVYMSLDQINWVPIEVYLADTRTQIVSTPETYEDHTTYYTMFDFEGEAYLKVKYNNPTKNFSTKIRPVNNAESVEINPTAKTEIIKFTKTCQLSYEVNGDIYYNLHIFANPLENYNLTGEVIYLAPGIYTADNCDYIKNVNKSDGSKAPTLVLKTNQTLYIAGGAVVKAGIQTTNARNVKIMGRGIVDMRTLNCGSHPAVNVSFCNSVLIDGLMFCDPAYYTVFAGQSSDLRISNIKSISYTIWSDGVGTMACNNVKVSNSFFRTNDDGLAIYASTSDYYGDAYNHEYFKCVLWADNAHAINIGNLGSGDRYNRDYIYNIKFRDLDILEVHSMESSGAIHFACGSENIIKDFLFEDIRVDDFTRSDLLKIHFIENEVNGVGYSISNIKFKNIYYTDVDPKGIIIKGYSAERTVKDIYFENLYVNGRKATKNTLNLITNEFASNIVFS